ncbi:MAG: DUF4331 domain-containing protein [Chthonomonadaceae bacterium]|nr:DUF4331 domain-containing protein [Chthonomonadaceae bacterium]
MKKLISMATIASLGAAAMAASHSDAPMMLLDPAANITDVYAFIGRNNNDVKVLNLVMNTNPLEDPGNGVIYYRFDDDVMYELNVCKATLVNGQPSFSGFPSIKYQIRFSSRYKNKGTILSYGLGTEAGPINNVDDARQNYTQTYKITKIVGNQSTVIGDGVLVPPVNVGPRTTPKYYDANGNRIEGATSFAQLDDYTKQTVTTLNDGTRTFAGTREDGFYADVAGIFDFLGIRNPGKDSFSGFNVQSINLQIPLGNLLNEGDVPVVGVFGATYRPSVRIRSNGIGGSALPWTQVSRMGNPLFNEVLVALKDKDIFNQTQPNLDTTYFRQYANKPELAFLANAVLGTQFQEDNRSDLVNFFIPDVIKVDATTPPVPLAGSQAFNRLSVFGGDTVPSTFTGGQVASGWPNGRRLGDDVVDIALTALASGPSYNTITIVSDNSNSNDSLYNQVFPYTGTPFGGPTSDLHR